MQRFFHQLCNKIWYQKHWLTYLLLPFSYLYHFIIMIRRICYRFHIKKTTRFQIPIIVVGNITVGGTGKTPLVIALAQYLQQQGFKPGIVSCGYGGQAKHFPVYVTAESDPILVGDEPVLIAHHTQCPIYVAPSRVKAVNQLLKAHACNIIISDDGLQHYALQRDIEIAVIDGERRFGNGFCLPAGPLREPIQRLKRVDFIVCNGEAQAREYTMQLLPGKIYHLQNRALHFNPLPHQTIHAVVAIGNPSRFFNLLRQLGHTIIEHPFPDHYIFQAKDFDFGENAIIIMTEKDAVKCHAFADQRFWCLPVQAQLTQDFYKICMTELGRFSEAGTSKK